jgi:hypothetical protein
VIRFECKDLTSILTMLPLPSRYPQLVDITKKLSAKVTDVMTLGLLPRFNHVVCAQLSKAHQLLLMHWLTDQVSRAWRVFADETSEVNARYLQLSLGCENGE